MYIGLISDTHGVFDDRFREFLEPVDEIWHAAPLLRVRRNEGAHDPHRRLSRTMPEYLDAVARFVLVETADAAVYVLRIEKFHDPCKLVL